MTSSRNTPYAAMPSTLRAEIQLAGLDGERVHALVADALGEDLPHGGEDVTSVATIPEDQMAVADFVAREQGVVAGTTVAEVVFRYVMGDDVTVTRLVNDGQPVVPGDAVLRVEGPTRGLLTAERTALNLLCHLSGVATATARWVAALDGSRTRVLDTRKTLPGLRIAQKYAVSAGGCHNHRLGLWDAFLIKENHIAAAGSIAAAITAAHRIAPGRPVEVEVENLAELAAALDAGADIVMLDDFTLADTHAAVQLNQRRAKLEISGGVNEQTLVTLAGTGVDYISIGSLTKHVRAVDLSMRLEEIP